MRINNNYANFGCGPIFSEIGFDNYDYYGIPGKIKKLDLTKPLNIPDDSYKFCYSSHCLEHISYKQVIEFLKEIYRILKPKGIVRIVVPDFESLVKEYIFILKKVKDSKSAKEDDKRNKINLQFIVDLILDDLTKEDIYGLKDQRLASGYYDSKYVKEVSSLLNNGEEIIDKEVLRGSKLFLRKLKTFIKTKNKLNIIKNKIFFSFVKDPRKNGFAHKWIWDEMQLFYVLQDIGFSSIKRHDFNTSDLEDWHKFKLDSNKINQPLHPLSLYIEASK